MSRIHNTAYDNAKKSELSTTEQPNEFRIVTQKV